MAQANDLDHALQGENCGEQNVENVQNVGDVVCHLVVVHSHGDHVQENHTHDAQVKLAAHSNIVEDSLNCSL